MVFIGPPDEGAGLKTGVDGGVNPIIGIISLVAVDGDTQVAFDVITTEI